jgi:hypothetical protein
MVGVLSVFQSRTGLALDYPNLPPSLALANNLQIGPPVRLQFDAMLLSVYCLTRMAANLIQKEFQKLAILVKTEAQCSYRKPFTLPSFRFGIIRLVFRRYSSQIMTTVEKSQKARRASLYLNYVIQVVHGCVEMGVWWQEWGRRKEKMKWMAAEGEAARFAR